jgi:glycosyltransferase involved in cell wall biosynthesis
MSSGQTTILVGATVPETVRHFVIDQARFLASNGFDVHVACSDVSEFIECESEQLHFHAVFMEREARPGRDVLSLVAWLQLIRLIKPDILMSGTPKAGFLAILGSWMYRTPVRIYLLRGLRLEGLSGRARQLNRIMEKIACRLATDVVCVSESLARQVAELGISHPDRTIVLGNGGSNGVDVNYFRPPTPGEREAARTSFSIPANALVIGFAGRLTADKGLPQLVEAFRSLDTEGAWLIIAGDLDAARPLDPETLSMLDSSRCLLLGHVSDIRSFFWALDVFCLPSLREGMPNVNLEAAATGLPVITTDATGCADSVLDGVTGYVCAKGSSASILEALTRLSNVHTRNSLGQSGRRWITQSFSNEIVWFNLLAFLRGSA